MKIGDKIRLCKCGCGNWIFYKYKHRWNKIPEYLIGHNLRCIPSWNKGLSKESDIRVKLNTEKSGRTLKKLYSEGKLKPYSHWTGKKLGIEHCEKIRKGNTGKKMSTSSKYKIRLSVKNRIKEGSWICPSKSLDARNKKSETMKKLRREQPQRYKIVYGKDHPMWIDGRSYIKYPYEFKLIRGAIINRDAYICQECGSLDGLEVHHIDHNKQNSNPFNLITLCKLCHVKERWNIFVKSFIYKTILSERHLEGSLVEVKGDKVTTRN